MSLSHTGKIVFLLGYISWTLCYCGQKSPKRDRSIVSAESVSKVQNEGASIVTRFKLPEGFKRISVDSISFGSHLRNLPLKPTGSSVLLYSGKVKPTNVHEAVVDLPIGKRDLHQCADAVMRLRADYFFQNRMFDSIHFNFTNGFKANYTNWRQGNRIFVEGNKVSWKRGAQASDSPKDYWKYLEMVFSYAGTASLSKELQAVSTDEMRMGDVFIQGGFPGHAVIVVDMAVNELTKEKIFLMAQSYMPAQEIHVLKNPNNNDLSPWYSVDEISNALRTPEWTFYKTDLKRF